MGQWGTMGQWGRKGVSVGQISIHVPQGVIYGAKVVPGG